MNRWFGIARAVLVVAAWTACPQAGAQSAVVTACPPQATAPSPAQLQAAAQTARDRGALWRITRDGRSAYLFGTLHVGKLEWAMPGPKVTAALKASDTIALELDPTDPQIVARLSAPQNGKAPPPLPAALAERIARRLDAACLPPQVRPLLDAQHPVLRAVTLTLLDSRWDGLDAGYGQEIVLAGYGRSAQRRVVSLETPEMQLAALIPPDAAEVDKMIAGMLDQLDSGAARRTMARLANAWARGDLREIEQYERWCECMLDERDRKALARLLDERNPGLADRIEALHREGRRLFAAVGALHMVGPQGLPALLQARGFVVERIAFQ